MTLNQRTAFLLAIIGTVHLILAGESPPILLEGDPCTILTACSNRIGLSCLYGFCRYPLTKIFEDGACSIRIGQQCRSNNNLEPCVKNAECTRPDSKYVCTCKNEYFGGPNGTCSREKNFGDTCVFNEECTAKNKGLFCINGVCQCDSTVSQFRVSRKNSWSQEQGEGCVGLATQPCLNELCVENSECSRKDKICTCRCNYKTTSQNICAGVSGANCPCAEGFICVDKKCRCELSHLQYYNNTEKTCSSYVGSPCNDDNLKCIGSAECVKTAGNRRICECPEGSLETIGGRCELSYGSFCNTGIREQCDSLAFLHCKNNICSCIDGSVYEENERRCAMPAGFRCDEKESSKIYCVANAECTKTHPKLSGRCQCKEGFVMSSAGSCEKSVEYLINES